MEGSHNGGQYVVCARMGDPIVRPARARLIWAAQTAQAMADLGVRTTLAGSAVELPFKVESPQWLAACRRLVEHFYNVPATFDVHLLYPSRQEGTAVGAWEADVELPRHVLPFARIVHTRDPRVVAECVNRQVPVIYEDHNEDYHLGVDPDKNGLNDESCKAIVAITRSVQRRLIATGVSEHKIIVLDSGVNPRSFEPMPEMAESWRRFLLRGGYKYIAAYTGGMQDERGIGDILNAAMQMPDTIFAFAGGNKGDNQFWKTEATRYGLRNVKFLGYMPQQAVNEIQQAADVQILSRSPGDRSEITSPLKFFEYLASGTPILSARLPVIDEREFASAPVEWYDSTNPGVLAECLYDVFDAYPYVLGGRDAGRDMARRYDWRERQKSILRFIGLSIRTATA